MIISNLVKRIIFGYRYDSDSYVGYLRKIGCKIGENTFIRDPRRTWIDPTRPCLIDIGNNVRITRGVTILTHGYDWSVLKGKYGEIIGSAGKVTIGDNVFIGNNAMILKGVTIGDNVVIGAGSVVTKDIPSDSVAAGNPAKIIMSIAEYYKKRKEKTVEEAKELAVTYYTSYKKTPPITLFHDFFWLFLERKTSLLEKYGFRKMLELQGNYDESLALFMESKPIYNGFEDFIKDCNLEKHERTIGESL